MLSDKSGGGGGGGDKGSGNGNGKGRTPPLPPSGPPPLSGPSPLPGPGSIPPSSNQSATGSPRVRGLLGEEGGELVAPSVHSEEGGDIAELFGDIDWTNANLGELEQQWRAELAAIEEENVAALIESASKTQLVVPALSKAIEETASVDALLSDYGQRLQMMGHEIQQIEELNRGLNIQTANQTRLLAELDSILARINLPEDVVRTLEMPLDVRQNIAPIAAAATHLLRLINTKFDDGLGSIRAVSERMQYYLSFHRRFVDNLSAFFSTAFIRHRERFLDAKRRRGVARLVGHDEVLPFLEQYEPLIAALREMEPRKHAQLVALYQTEMGVVFKKEMAELLEAIKTGRLIRRAAEEKSYLFVSMNNASMAAMGERIINLAQQKSAAPSERNFAAIAPFDYEKFPDLDANEPLSSDQALHYIIVSVALLMARQQHVCAKTFFGISPEDHSNERILKLVDSMLTAIFAPLEELLSAFVEAVSKADNSTSIEMIVCLDLRIPQLTAELPAFVKILQGVKRRLLVVADHFISDQVAVIDSMKFSARKRSGVFPFVSLFPTFIARVEKIVGAVEPGCSSRDFMNKGYEKITAAIFRSLDALAKEAERSADEKECINASVMNIQNSHFLVTQLNSIKSGAVEASLRLAKTRYDNHLSLYSSRSLRRVFGKLIEFFEGVSAMLENTPPEEVAFHASYNKASAKRVLQSFPIREVRKNLEMVYGRVQKHFNEDKGLQQVVWRSLQDEFLKDISVFSEAIQKVYPATDVQLGYSVPDAMACFSDIAKR